MKPTPKRYQGKARARRRSQPPDDPISFLQWIGWVEDLQGIEGHLPQCRLAPSDPHERRMHVLALFLDLNGSLRHQALRELLEVRRQVGSPVTEDRLKEIVDAAYAHPVSCRE